MVAESHTVTSPTETTTETMNETGNGDGNEVASTSPVEVLDVV